MKLWSQLARLGAAVAALAPAVAHTDAEPDQVEMPTLDIANQPLAAATVGADSVDRDANLLEDMVINPKLHVASLPLAPQLPPTPEERIPGPPRIRPQGGARPHVKVLPHEKSWHGGGQRYEG